MKYILIIGDGMGDYPIEQLEYKTPLQLAEKPNIDNLVKKSRVGYLTTIPKGMSPGSDIANLSILGYNPREYYSGRGPLEAASIGIRLGDNDIALRCNLVTEEKGILKDNSAGHISNKEAEGLINILNKEFGNDYIKFYNGNSYRHILILNGLFSEEINCVAPHDILDKEIKDFMIEPKNNKAKVTAETLNKMILDSKTILENCQINTNRIESDKNPANMIWPWSPGKKPNLKTFEKLYGIKGAVISGVDLIKGIGFYAGFDIINVDGATGYYDTNYEGKADACLSCLENYDFILAHIEAPDEAGHEGKYKTKIQAIENIDKRLVGRILSRLKEEVNIAILPDHLTPVKERTHVADKVPFLIYNPREKPDNIKSFDEFSVKEGSLGTLDGEEFIKLFLSYENKVK